MILRKVPIPQAIFTLPVSHRVLSSVSGHMPDLPRLLLPLSQVERDLPELSEGHRPWNPLVSPVTCVSHGVGVIQRERHSLSFVPNPRVYFSKIAQGKSEDAGPVSVTSPFQSVKWDMYLSVVL